MESLHEIVAASFARHGIECPDGVSRLVGQPAPAPVQPATGPLAGPTALAEHSYRKLLEGDPAP